MILEDKDIAEALDRLAHTADGEVLYRYLQKIVMWVPGLEEGRGALRVDQGRRRFALDLMGLMAKGIDERADHSPDVRASERTVVFRPREPRRVAGHVSAREHIRATDAEFKRFSAGDGSGNSG